MSIIFASAMLMYLMVLLLFPFSMTDLRIESSRLTLLEREIKEEFLEKKKMQNRKWRMRKLLDMYQVTMSYAIEAQFWFVYRETKFLKMYYTHPPLFINRVRGFIIDS